MPEREEILALLRTIDDPEMPISIVDLGLVEKVDIDGATVTVTILPTFVGCPALPMIESMIRRRVTALAGVDAAEVNFVHDPPWTVDRISKAGRASLGAHGVTVPEPGQVTGASVTSLRTSAIPCPYCGSSTTRLDSPFGPTRCRMIFYCESCRNQFEHMKRVPAGSGPSEDASVG